MSSSVKGMVFAGLVESEFSHVQILELPLLWVHTVLTRDAVASHALLQGPSEKVLSLCSKFISIL